MFKKLLVGGALVAGLALTGGIATASAANKDFTYNDCYSSGRTYTGTNGTVYVVYEVRKNHIFESEFTDGKIQYHLQGIKPVASHCGKGYVGYYEGKKI
ncbi:LCI family antimicrobial peptide [Xenorhabdus bharatensis]|uniref:LCI family antimicrobial peptide n=1 Tax=Xenorhabdus bharatensis TaxID=3136256 RepID=UPI0030F432A0